MEFAFLTFFLSLIVLFNHPFAHSIPDGFLDNPIRQITDGRLPNLEIHFFEFLKRFNKKYSGPEEHGLRFSIFKSNLLKALEHQALNPTAIHGVTKFSDLTEEEFQSQYLGLGRVPHTFRVGVEPAPILPTDNLPMGFDWRDIGAVTPVKNQASCGSCWAFSTTGALEGSHFLRTGRLMNLSEQQLVDCDHGCESTEEGLACNSGCNGGLMTTAFQYTVEVGGLQRGEDYLYKGVEGPCKFNRTKVAARVANFSIVSIDEDQMAANLVKHGPLSVGINAAFMQSYVGGVSCPYICSKSDLNHGVLIVGYGQGEYVKSRLRKMPFWVIKNSWGADWGENGYYKLCRGHNVCGVANIVSTVTAAIV